MNYYGINHSDESLKHYGVIGMKWGIRRARRIREKAAAGKYGEGKKKAVKLAKANVIEQKGKSLGGAAYGRVKKQGWAKTIGQTALFGTYGALNYNKLRAKGNGRIMSGTGGVTSGMLNTATSGLAGVVAPRVTASNSSGVKRAAANEAYKAAKKKKKKDYE